MKTDTPRSIHLRDYRPPEFLIDKVFLDVTLSEDSTIVDTRLQMRRNANAESPDAVLTLDGEYLETLRVAVDGNILDDSAFSLSKNTLKITNLPASFVVETSVRIHPENNTALEDSINLTPYSAPNARHKVFGALLGISTGQTYWRALRPALPPIKLNIQFYSPTVTA